MVLHQPPGGPGPRTISEGDLVIVYESHTSIKSVYIDSKSIYSSRFGNFHHKDWVGKPFGCRAFSRPPGRGWVQLLAPTPELWTLVLRHRTQILYVADISLVVSNLELAPGCTVLESGTGSASLTHSLVRAVAPSGRVRSFEFHELRARDAAAELVRNGLPPHLASVTLRNVEECGFPVEELTGAADAVFLDLPGPWKVVPSAAACLKPNGRFCSFSPCIEQVQRTCEQLDGCGMTDIVTYEVLLRNYEVTEETLLVPLPGGGGAGPGAEAGPCAGSGGGGAVGGSEREGGVPGACSGLGGADVESAAPAGSEEAAHEAGGSRKRGRDEQQGPASDSGGAQAPGSVVPDGGATTANARDGDGAPPNDGNQGGGGGGSGGRRHAPANNTRPVPMVVARPSMEARGHTGYLTFARKWV